MPLMIEVIIGLALRRYLVSLWSKYHNDSFSDLNGDKWADYKFMEFHQMNLAQSTHVLF